jgi:hypothetical protein
MIKGIHQQELPKAIKGIGKYKPKDRSSEVSPIVECRVPRPVSHFSTVSSEPMFEEPPKLPHLDIINF